MAEIYLTSLIERINSASDRVSFFPRALRFENEFLNEFLNSYRERERAQLHIKISFLPRPFQLYALLINDCCAGAVTPITIVPGDDAWGGGGGGGPTAMWCCPVEEVAAAETATAVAEAAAAAFFL